IALRQVGSSFARFECPGKRAVHAFHLQRTERAAQAQSLTGRSIDYDQVLDGTAVLQPLAKAAAGFEIETAIAGIAGEGVRGTPPLADLAQRSINLLWRSVDRHGLDNLEPARRD